MKTLKIILFTAVAAALTITCVACDELSDKREKLAVPDYIIADDYVYWAPVTGAAGYVVSVNGQDMPVQTDCGLAIDKTQEVSVKVKAVAAEGSKDYKDSDFGAAAFRSADVTQLTEIKEITISGSVSNEHDFGTVSDNGMNYDLKLYTITLSEQNAGYFVNFNSAAGTLAQYKFVVPSAVKLIKLYTYENLYRISFEIETRTDPVIFEFHGAKIRGIIDTPAIYTAEDSVVSGAADVVIRSFFKDTAGFDGERIQIENEIYGGNNTVIGKSGDGYNSVGFGKTGGKGGEGYSAVKAPKVVFSGDESVFVKGGKGGNGGTGGEAKKGLFGIYINEGGHGGDGGNGGSGITAEKVFINVSTGKPLKAAGGEGGSGGAKGPGANSLGSNKAENGSKGTPIVGEQIIIKGSVEVR